MKSISAKILIKEYGETVKIQKYNETKKEITKAFIQPLKHNDNKNICGNYMDIGFENDGLYLYIGDPRVRLDTYPFDSKIETGMDNYVLKNAEKICVGNEIIYIRAILKKCS